MDSVPAFEGFPREGLEFLRGLAANNNRSWFEALGERLLGISDDIEYDSRVNGGSILRIYRDTRFSKDKTPYNTRLRALFWQGPGKKGESPGFYFGMDADGAAIYAGMHGFSKSTLELYRDAVADDRSGPELERILASVKEAGDYQVGGEHYKRVPRGYDPEHPRAELLRYNGLWALSPQMEAKVLVTPKLVEACYEHCRTMAHMQQWLVELEQRSAGS